MTNTLTGKVALITGASKGIGRAIAAHFAQLGADVAFTYLSSVEKGQALETELSAIRRLEARSTSDTALIRRLVINMAAKDGLITIAERDSLLAQ